MAYKKSYSPFSFARGAIFASITLIVLSARPSQAMPGKASADTEISFVSSESDWSKDLDNVKSFGPSANAANLDPIIGYEAYRTLRFKIIRKLISVGPNLWTLVLALPPIQLRILRFFSWGGVLDVLSAAANLWLPLVPSTQAPIRSGSWPPHDLTIFGFSGCLRSRAL